jgi:hypothetical protein
VPFDRSRAIRSVHACNDKSLENFLASGSTLELFRLDGEPEPSLSHIEPAIFIVGSRSASGSHSCACSRPASPASICHPEGPTRLGEKVEGASLVPAAHEAYRSVRDSVSFYPHCVGTEPLRPATVWLGVALGAICPVRGMGHRFFYNAILSAAIILGFVSASSSLDAAGLHGVAGKRSYWPQRRLLSTSGSVWV